MDEYARWYEEELAFERRQSGTRDEEYRREYEDDLNTARRVCKAWLRFAPDGAIKYAVEALLVFSPFDAEEVVKRYLRERQAALEAERQAVIDSVVGFDAEDTMHVECPCHKYGRPHCGGQVCKCPYNACECQWSSPPPTDEETEKILQYYAMEVKE